MVLENCDRSVELALELDEINYRVIRLSMGTQIKTSDELKSKLKRSHVKILKQLELKEISGANSVKKVKIHDLDEDEIYELFVDGVVFP